MKRIGNFLLCMMLCGIAFAQNAQFGRLSFEVPAGFKTEKNNNTLYLYDAQRQLCAVVYSPDQIGNDIEESLLLRWNTKENFPDYRVGEITRRYRPESAPAKSLRADHEGEDGSISKTVIVYEYAKTGDAVITYTNDAETKYAVEELLKSLRFITPELPAQLSPLERSYNWYKALRGPDASNASIQAYQSQTTINFTGFHAASQDHLQKLGDSLFYLRELPDLHMLFIGQTRLNDAAAANIGLLPAIKHVQSIDQGLAMPLGVAGLQGLSRASTLEVIDLRAVDIPGATDAGLAHLAKLTRLKKLILSRATTVTIHGIEHLTALKQLQELNLSFCSVSDADIPRLTAVLQQLPALKLLFLQTTGITEAGVIQLRQTFPTMTLYR